MRYCSTHTKGSDEYVLEYIFFYRFSLLENSLMIVFSLHEKVTRKDSVYGDMTGFTYPGRYITHNSDAANMKVTNFEAANEFIKRTYRKSWGELKL